MVKDGYIITFTGRHICPLDPDPAEIDPLDIAHALALVNRFTGHTRAPLSVAQHSCNVHDLLEEKFKLWGLLHDATEAYLSDLARPVKLQDDMEFYRKAEHKLMKAVAKRFGLRMPMPKAVKEADDIMLYTEMRDFLGVPPNGHKVFPATLEVEDWKTAKLNFLNRLKYHNIKVEVVVV